MIETILGGGVIGSLIGGAFRLAPEVLKWLDRKNERSHELAMFDRQCQLEQARGAQKLAEIGAERDMAIDSGVIGAFQTALQQQTEMVKAAGGRVASLSASVRPVMTYYLLLLYGAVKAASVVLALDAGDSIAHVLPKHWTADDMALLCGVVNYWIMDRTLAKRGLA
ncbi:hypothetical protein [Thauera phenylacetica]|uniref:hypothetical protein n=1 Tax=Thauera phenylacetica TaxID=164400 RepID=UPI0039E41BC9